MIIKHSLKPIYDKNSKVLILGTMPSIKSRELNFYYAHPNNRFWTVLENVFEEKIIDKKEFLISKNIALWDVIYSCEIKASADYSIKNVKVNNINKIIKESHIKYIFTTGRKAYELYNRYLFPKCKIKAVYLSSTSPANASKNLNALVKEYKIIKDYLF